MAMTGFMLGGFEHDCNPGSVGPRLRFYKLRIKRRLKRIPRSQRAPSLRSGCKKPLPTRRFGRLFLLHGFDWRRCRDRSCGQAHLLADLEFDLGGDVLIVFEELFGVLAALADA